MKLQHLAIGDRFEYEGAVYVKTGPLTAASDKGGQRVIPRSAVLAPVGSGAAAATAEDRLERRRVLLAFEAFYADCAARVDAAGQAALATARQRFLAALADGDDNG